MKPPFRLPLFFLLGGLTALSAPSFAQSEAANQPVEKAAPELGEVQPAGPVLKRGDQRLIKKITACGAYELAISRQAVTRATHAEVRAYAETVVRSLELMNGELATLAKHRGAKIVIEHKQADDVAELAKKTGDDYDEDYLEEIIDAHEDAIALLEKGAKSADTDVAAFSVHCLARVQDHLVRARQLEKQID